MFRKCSSIKNDPLSYPTVLKALTVIRMAIIANSADQHLLAREIELDESYFGGKRKGKRGRGAFNKVPIFGILELDGIVKVEAVKDVSAETLLNLTIKTVRRGSIVYTYKFRSYDALMCCGYRHLKVDHGNIGPDLHQFLGQASPVIRDMAVSVITRSKPPGFFRKRFRAEMIQKYVQHQEAKEK